MKTVCSVLLFVAFCITTINSQTVACVEENELTANPSNCNQYYRCLSRERILFSCTAGKVFNPITKRCVTSDTYSCNEQQPETTTVAASQQCQLNRNGVVAHPSDCDKYVVCEEGIAKTHTCPQGEQFSWRKLACGASYSCEGYFNHSTSSLEAVACSRQSLHRAEHPYEVGMYVDCQAVELRSCDEGSIFRWNYQRCLPGAVSTNELKTADASCGAFGKSPHPYLCEKFFKCFFWISGLQSCPLGTIYSAAQEECIEGDFQTCTFAHN
uniref:Chitin-binding type-2 domain-containing protein n=1 Tax=Anopheles stephensi TaxID=30069 RepID=A0A182YLS8_ANOST